MFAEGSGYHPLLKYLYDRHVVDYAAIPGSRFKPYLSMKTPGDILSKVKK